MEIQVARGGRERREIYIYPGLTRWREIQFYENKAYDSVGYMRSVFGLVLEATLPKLIVLCK